MIIGRLLTLTAFFAQLGAASAAVTYNITDLGTLGGTSSAAYGINAGGQVVGQSQSTGNATNVAVTFGYPNVSLGSLGGTSSQANGINTAGVIVGSSKRSGDNVTQAFASFGNFIASLGTLGGTNSYAYGVNDLGMVTGYSQLGGDTEVHAFRYQSGIMADISTLGGVAHGYAINATGHVVGQSDSPFGNRAFIAVSTTSVSLGTLGTGDSSAAYGINDNDQIVGTSNLAPRGTISHAFFYQNNTMTDLGALGYGELSTAYAINNSSMVVGESNLWPRGTLYHAFLSQGGQMTDLNDLIPQGSGWVLNTARAINNNGQIAGSGTINGQPHAFLLTPLSSYNNNNNGNSGPRVYINGGDRIVTDKPKYRVEGSVGGPVTAVKYRVNKGGYLKANGGTNGWKFTAKLKRGRNVILVVSYDASGNVSFPAKVVIVRK